MKKSIRLTAFLLALILIMTAFSGCAGGESGGDDEPTIELTGAQQKWVSMFGEKYVTERAAYEKEHNPYNVPEELKGTTVKFATWIDHNTTEAKYPMSTFEKVTGIKVEWVDIPSETYVDKLASLNHSF